MGLVVVGSPHACKEALRPGMELVTGAAGEYTGDAAVFAAEHVQMRVSGWSSCRPGKILRLLQQPNHGCDNQHSRVSELSIRTCLQDRHIVEAMCDVAEQNHALRLTLAVQIEWQGHFTGHHDLQAHSLSAARPCAVLNILKTCS